MSLHNPAAFFDMMRSGLLGPTLSATEVDGCNAILDEPTAMIAPAFEGRFRQVAFSRSPIRKPTRRGRDSFFKRNAALQALVESGHADAIAPTRRRQAGKVIARNRDSSEAALVFSALLKSCGPAAVARLIIPARIDPINSQTFGSLSHVGEEGGKGLLPSRTNTNTLRTVFREVFMAGIGAAPLDSKPNAIGRAGIPTPFMPVLRNASPCHVTCIAESAK